MKCEVWWAKWKLLKIKICILNHQQLYQIKWEKDKLGTTSSETCTITSSCKYFWCGTLVCVKSNWLQIFERSTSFELISSTQLCFKHHQPNVWNANVQSPLQKFQLECKYSRSKCNHFESCQFWPTSNFVSATRICQSKLQLFCASCEGLADWTFGCYRANWTWQ